MMSFQLILKRHAHKMMSFQLILKRHAHDDDPLVNTEGYVLLAAFPIATIDDGKVHLKWGPDDFWTLLSDVS